MTVGVIVEADEPVLLFTSPEAAEGYIEVIDVYDGVYPRAYAPDGSILDIIVEDGMVRLRPSSEKPQPHALRKLIITFLERINEPSEQEEQLDRLLIRCEKYVTA